MVKNHIVILVGMKNDGDIDTFDDDIGGEMTDGCVEVRTLARPDKPRQSAFMLWLLR